MVISQGMHAHTVIMIRRGKGTTDTETMTLRRETCSQGAHSPTFHDNMATLFPKIDGISLELLVKAGDKPVVEINCGASSILISHRGLSISSKARVSSFLIIDFPFSSAFQTVSVCCC